ncbi:cyclopropane-fatty-acyl-phospholipid synthase [Colletotrichum plurivorum]|uniref:sphingolipid C(9)-methyltransferase n=1 Tax=Colletotrichum plurivorum TaxID=2175906 RepID=A0A8H6K9E7_9PEZI|nr:cyclopropane-fatty-acyl-phospholipid synthase [Colletotrichum plurivorum]
MKNPTLPADGPGHDTFSHRLLASLLFLAPAIATWKVGGGYLTFVLFFVILQVPIAVAFWFVASRISPPVCEKVRTPGRPVEEYLEFRNERDRKKYWGRHKIPMERFAEMYVGGEVEVQGDLLEVLEVRYDWACWKFTWGFFRVVVFGVGRMIMRRFSSGVKEGHVKKETELGSEFYSWFLGPRLLYGSGVVSDLEVEEPLKELQDNKVAVVCEKIGLRPGDRMLDLGCGWGALATFASVNYAAEVTGTTYDQAQADLGNWRLREAGVPENQSRIRVVGSEVTGERYDKITCLRTGEQLSGQRMGRFFERCYEMLEDDGVMFVEVSGLRMAWQYEDLVWGLFLAKYIPGVGDMLPLPVYVGALEAAGFEVQSIDNVGYHYSATVWRWYKNWVGNAGEVKAKYGERIYRIWEYFLATATIMARQGTMANYQITLVKNLNGVSRVGMQGTRLSVDEALGRSRAAEKAVFPV